MIKLSTSLSFGKMDTKTEEVNNSVVKNIVTEISSFSTMTVVTGNDGSQSDFLVLFQERTTTTNYQKGGRFYIQTVTVTDVREVLDGMIAEPNELLRDKLNWVLSGLDVHSHTAISVLNEKLHFDI